MAQQTCGFVVVRKPDFAVSSLVTQNMRIGNKIYRGIDRLRWEDLSLAYYDGCLPTSLLPIWNELKQENRDLSGIEMLKNYQHAKDVLQFSGEKSEIIALWSPELEELKGCVSGQVKLKFLGLDCVAMSDPRYVTVEWSVLLAGVYAQPKHFPWAVQSLNDHGLLTSLDECRAVFRKYLELSANDTVEPLSERAAPMSVKVFAVVA